MHTHASPPPLVVILQGKELPAHRLGSMLFPHPKVFHNNLKDIPVVVWVLETKVQDTLVKAEQKGSMRMGQCSAGSSVRTLKTLLRGLGCAICSCCLKVCIKHQQ